MTQATDTALVGRLRKRLAEASPQPWVYRPDRLDDWGWIRGTERDSDIGRYRPIVAKGMDSEVAEEQKATHREAKTDPFGPNALLITDAVNALPGLLDTIEAQARRIEALEGVVATIMGRCEVLEDEAADGLAKEMGDHAQGWYRGQKDTAKSLRRHLHDLTRPTP